MLRSVWNWLRPTKAELIVLCVPSLVTMFVCVPFALLLEFRFGWTDHNSFIAMIVLMVPVLGGSYGYLRYRLREQFHQEVNGKHV